MTRNRLIAGTMAALGSLILSISTANCAGCLGKHAREHVQMPAVVKATEGLRADAQRGILTLDPALQPAAAEQLETFTAAIDSEDRERIAGEAWPLWPAVRALAFAGITAKETAGEIGPGVADSLRERVDSYDVALGQLIERLR